MTFPRSTLSVLIALLFSESVSAASLYQEEGKLIRAPRAMGVLGDNLFGDETNYYNGSLSFAQTDVSLPGNNALPMAVTRRFSTGHEKIPIGHFGNWDLDIPHLYGTFAPGGWLSHSTADANKKLRCTHFGAPPLALGTSGGFTPGAFGPTEFWHGNLLMVNGNSQEVLRRNTGTYTAPNRKNENVPTDGNTYNLVTKNLWALSCLQYLQSDPNGGEGFVAVSPDGTSYRFDWMATRMAISLTKSSAQASTLAAGDGSQDPASDGSSTDTSGTKPKPLPDSPTSLPVGEYNLNRVEVWIMPTLVTDRFGNTVTYTYSATNKWQLLSMQASDGRKLTFSYVSPDSNQISSVTDGTRTWNYSYLAGVDYGGVTGRVLNEVTNPDNSKWKLAEINNLAYSFDYLQPPTCSEIGSIYSPGQLIGVFATVNLTHPSGAVGRFTIQDTVHSRAQVPFICRDSGTNRLGHVLIPRDVAQASLVEKTLSGPGLPGMTWRMAYSTSSGSWSACTSNCGESKTTTVTDPNGDKTRYTFGTVYKKTEGLLQQTDTGFNGTSALRTTLQHYRDANVGPYVNPIGFSDQTRGDAEISALHLPQDQRITTQQGVNFTWQADPNSFDSKARPGIINKSSTLGYSRSEQTVYADAIYTNFTAKWVLGQVASVTERNTGLVMLSNTFDPATTNITSTSHFGHLDQSMTYNPDGTLATRKDGKNQTTTFSNYKRGLAQNVSYPDTTSESATVNDIGLITSTTDANSFTTSYDYDSAGRLKAIYYPPGDSVNWTPTTLSYEQVGADELGIAPGHWRETVTTGNAKAITYLDAFWRPVITSTFDAADAASETATRRMVLKRYDYRSKPTFESYPQRSISSVNDSLPGTSTRYDALARPTYTGADSELGVLNTSISYDNGFKKTVTNPRGYAMTTSYQAFDEASEGAISRMDEPKGISIVINRDLFGKPLSINRSAAGSSFTRSYVYDPNQRLCKTIDPEIGATMQDYDLANNVTVRAIGVASLLSTTSCDTGSIPTNRRISYTYDALNRLTSTSYADGSPGITRTYTPDGLPNTISSDGAVWTNSYNKRRLNERESLAYASNTYNIGHSYDALGSMSALSYPDGTSIDFAPNALGEISKVGSFASNINYYPNGAVAGFTYGNGIVHSMTQNTRNLPQLSQDGAIIQDQYSYDANGNVTAISDLLNSSYNRSMTYDELDRLATAEALGVWGTASYTYDAQDNMIQSTVGLRKINHVFDTNNRLASINSSTTSAYNLSYSYDVQGNLTQRGTQSFSFDQGNRLKSAAGKASYNYDGLGRRVKIANADGSTRIQVYSAGGQLLYATQSGGSSPASATRYIYLRHGLIAEVAK